MIDFYYWTTPNGHKITIFLEEVGLPYNIIPVNIGAGEQFKPEFLAISPNNRIPAYERQSQKVEDFPNLQRPFETIKARPATIRAYQKAEALKTQPLDVEKSRDLLFNQSANTVRN